MSIFIAPSLLSANACCWGEEIRLIEAAGIQCLHLDIMDGQYVPNISFGPGPIKMLRSLTTMEFDAHLMVLEPAGLIPALVDAEVDSITVHVEACRHLHKTLQQIKAANKKVGVALNPATPVCMLEPVLDMLDRVLIMFVNPGFGGQTSIMSMLSKVTQLRELRQQHQLNFEIQVDGGLNQENLVEFLAAGAENLVIGSALFQPGKTTGNIRAFNTIIDEYQKSPSI
jgi:ribulose-phosphate 3-epimerase